MRSILSLRTRIRDFAQYGAAMVGCIGLVAELTAQQVDVETQVAGGFLVIDDVAALPGSDVVAVGLLASWMSGNDAGLVYRMSGSTVLWAKVLCDDGPGFPSSRLNAVITASNGDIVVAGEERRGTTEYAFLARLDASGTVLWTTSVNTDPDHHSFRDLCEAVDGSLYAVGWTGNVLQQNEVVARFTSGGSIMWMHEVDYPGSQYALHCSMASDTVLVSGSTTLGSGAQEISLFRYTSNGTLASFRTLGSSLNEGITDMASDGAGGHIVSFYRNTTEIGVQRLGPSVMPMGPSMMITSPFSLHPVGGVIWHAASEECTILGQAAFMSDAMGMAIRISFPTSSVVWDRSIVGAAFVGCSTKATNPSEVVGICAALGFTANGSYPAPTIRLDVNTGTDLSGSPCQPVIPLNPILFQASLSIIDYTLPSVSPDTNVIHGINEEDVLMMAIPCNNPALPIELTRWEATYVSNAVRLDWTTQTEHNNERFDIERSKDGDDWSSIGSVPGQINSQTEVNYHWTDQLPIQGTNYYRLRQTDIDGSSMLSDVVVMQLDALDSSFFLTPNPVSPGHIVTTTSVAALYDMTGKLVSGLSTTFRSPDIPGVYLVRSSTRSELLIVR